MTRLHTHQADQYQHQRTQANGQQPAVCKCSGRNDNKQFTWGEPDTKMLAQHEVIKYLQVVSVFNQSALFCQNPAFFPAHKRSTRSGVRSSRSGPTPPFDWKKITRVAIASVDLIFVTN